MARLLLLVALVGVVLWFIKSRARSDSGDKPAAKRPPAADAPQAMVACAHCGVHLPQGDATSDAAGRLFCSEAHRLAGPR